MIRSSLLLLVCGFWLSARAERTFEEDVAFLREHVGTLVLEQGDARVAVVPAYQGRVMTSTAGGGAGASFGWINHELIASGQVQPHINVYGGEDRFWMGPEGGQFAIFFQPGASFTLADWQTPAVIDTEPFETVATSPTEARFARKASFANFSGFTFTVNIDRTVRLLNAAAAVQVLGGPAPNGVRMVAYETVNTLTNAGATAWTKETGLLSIWILGMFKPSPETTIVIPYKPGPESDLGPIVNDAYFGKVPADRLAVKDRAVFFKGDGQQRGKIGISPQRALPVCGSYDASSGVLTLVRYNLPGDTTDYVNSMWERQDHPFAGDVVNSYNDGPPEPGKKPLGPFYELETSSPALALAPGESYTHTHQTLHLQGEEAVLDAVARKVLGVGLDAIKSAL